MKASLSCKVNRRRKCYILGAMFGPFSFINVSSGGEAENDMKIMVEIAVAFRIMQLLYKDCVSSKHKTSIAVLSPHPAQVKFMQQKLKNHQQNNEFFKVRVGCFHDYQRGGAYVVIISTVGADEDEANTNANVYLTWARCVRDERVHLKGVWKSLIVEAKARECFFRADENKDLAKVIFEVKKDLQQLDELLSGETFRHLVLFLFISSQRALLSLYRRLEGIIGMYTQEYIDHCKARCVQRGSEYPMKWPAGSQIVQYTTHANRCDEMAVNTIVHGCDGGDLGIPFELTEQEKNVVSFDKSSFIIGRSGTGKTTVLTMKLFQNEQLHHLACEGFHEVMKSKEEAKQDVLRQLFVTFSSKLCYAVGQNFGEWKRLTCGWGSSSQSSPTCIGDIDQLIFSEDILEKIIHLSHDVYPLIITFHRFLLMLDGTVGTSYFERFPNFRHLVYGNKTSTLRLGVMEQFMRLIVNDLHQRLEVEGYTGEMMDYEYVDEVQDLLMRQIMLFKYVCANVHEGFAFSGDTAQAIAKGIGFRFEDISVINLLCHFFPLCVDALSPETSRIDGDLPILLETDTNNDAIKFIFERNGYCSQVITGFGAEQVVLVRDGSLKEKVVDVVGKNALVLTIMESKGLEFQWKIIYNYMTDKDLLNSPCSCFNMQKHAVLCSELKQLYVAITRTRQRLWICESTGFSRPIYDYWKKLSLVEVKNLSDSFAYKMQIPSSIDEWRSRGIKLFYENNFRMAQMCFLKAGDEHSEKMAHAYHLRAISDKVQISQLVREKCLKDAAEFFSSIGKKVLAAECFYEIADYRTAGCIYKNESMWEKAGNCFYLAKCYELEVEEYEKAGDFAKCLSACTDGKLFEIGFELLGRCGDCGSPVQLLLHKGAHYFFSMKDSENMMKFVRIFCEKDKMRSFLTKRRCFDELIILEKEWINFEEAAEVMHKEKEWGNFEEAAEVTHKGAHNYFSIKYFAGMMKFVRSFYDKGEM
ncbi:hypothetical protein L1987_32997 [Smallanthus sonchifolius]|uniref:Uncharacterized protein n=1 Tax=Smallanthus sonchifolius TaxID=185202 RepID=A0ACB9HPS9_9ASTR|nr:hypothetical protein L1987_32997 [Smallanthus sonchifolius]